MVEPTNITIFTIKPRKLHQLEHEYQSNEQFQRINGSK